MDPSFIQLSQTQSHISNSSSSIGESEPQSGAPSSASSTSPSPGLSTHNTKRANYHVKDISEFARTLEISANRAFPNRGLTRYKRVEVLLLRWEEDELQVEWELNDLAKVFRAYNFNTETWLIPTESPYMKMMSKALQFVGDHQSEDTLLIVYYGGHAKINEARQSTWSCTRQLAHSSFEWNGCQALFEQSKSDTLLLLDCCAAAAAAATVPCRTNSIMEIIAACGWETWAPEPGRHSFTNTLIEVLEEWIDRKCFSAAMLHCEVLSILKQPRPRRNREISKTPVYIVSTSNPKTCSIELGRRPALTSLVGETTQAIDSTSSQNQPQASSSMETDAADSEGGVVHSIADNDPKFDLSSLLATLPDKTFVIPHVIMSVALEEDQVLDLDGFQNWMRLFPALAKYAKIEGVYRSHSTLVLVSVPVIIWNLLPEDPAFNFVGYARSANLLEPRPPLIQLSNDTSTSWAQDETSSLHSWGPFEMVVPGRTSILESALIAKYFAREGEKAHTPPLPTPPRSRSPPRRSPFLRKALEHPGTYAKIDQYTLGPNTLFDPSELAIADLVFVHGLGGGSKKTWMKGNNSSSFWPQEWLPKDDSFQNVRIHSFGYNSNRTNRENLLRIQDVAQAQSFREWQDRPEGTQIYWMSARPATGKTVLSGKVVAHLKSAGLDCSFYFFKNANKSNKSTISSFLLSMAWQMSQANTEILSNVLSICKEFNQVSKAHYQTLWRRLFLGGILRTRSQTPRYWIIDALDECMLGDELLCMLLEIPEEANLRIFVTSREMIDLDGMLLSPSLNVTPEEILVEDTRSDMELYLDASFNQLSIILHRLTT
ncbi:hypothetical protein BGZ57DRAFT_798548 [Hyaloscypha finlandica]|nr:hypothetical protein BGZ57DRAFT_798548 [Hyaloscypha finlandica]